MASTYFDLSAANAILKELYDGQVVENLVYEDNPFLALVPKDEEAGGKYIPQPVIIAASQGRSSAFGTAQTNQSGAVVQEFLLTRKPDYSIATIDNQTMLTGATDKMAFINTAKVVVDGAVRQATLSLASALFRSGTGSVGQVGAISTGVITLVNAQDVVQFELNQTLQAAATDGAAPRAALGYIIAVDRSAGTVTVSATAQGGSAGSPASWAANDFLLVQGDSNVKISGLLGWMPTTAPGGSDNFFGVNRSTDPVRLAGLRYNGASVSIEEALIEASAQLAREGGKPDVCILSYASYSALCKSLGSRVHFVDHKGPAEISFRGLEINGANSVIKVFPDRNCPSLTGFLLTMKTWKLYSLGKAPHIERYADGLEMLRVYNQDASELRVLYYAQLGCAAPGWNAVVTLGA